ncbi:MAG: hypothetical protein CM1200mP2_27080 [Planctomycetaceae bacterium]|nr:MAG: hypothetical protein CM1200mP2_27080 [Planctomycetaceae bacterium]
MADVNFFFYWNNAKLIGGQTKKIRASVYRKPRGGRWWSSTTRPGRPCPRNSPSIGIG